MSGAGTSEGQPGLVAGLVVADKYELIRCLGIGGMGEVWLARHRSLRTEVAVKFLSSDDADCEHRSRALERFRQEAQLSAQLGARTRHVVRVDDVGEDPAGPFLVMEYVRGRSLVEELAETGTFAPERVGAILAQLASTLAVVHEEGVVHRDLKPDNILLGCAEDGSLEVKLTDFGVAKAIRRSLAIDDVTATTNGLMVGTPEYMSPEQLFGTTVDERSDCWALGVMAYEMLVGRNPFVGPNVAYIIQRVLTGSVGRPSALRPDLPRALDVWFERALDKDRERRFGSVREMAVAYLASLEPQGKTVTMKVPSDPPAAVENADTDPWPRQSRPEIRRDTSPPLSGRGWARSLASQPPPSVSRVVSAAVIVVAVFGASVAVGRSTAAPRAAARALPTLTPAIASAARAIALPPAEAARAATVTAASEVPAPPPSEARPAKTPSVAAKAPAPAAPRPRPAPPAAPRPGRPGDKSGTL